MNVATFRSYNLLFAELHLYHFLFYIRSHTLIFLWLHYIQKLKIDSCSPNMWHLFLKISSRSFRILATRKTNTMINVVD